MTAILSTVMVLTCPVCGVGSFIGGWFIAIGTSGGGIIALNVAIVAVHITGTVLDLNGVS